MNSPAASSPSSLESPRGASVRAGGVTGRAVVLSLTLAVVLGYLIPVIDYKYANSFLGAMHLPPGAIAALLILVLIINPVLGLLSARARFGRNEALVVYISCLFSSLLPGHGAENFLMPNLLSPFYFATAENKWLDFLLPHTPAWLTPALSSDGTLDEAVVRGWYEGGAIPWAAWIVPLAAWSSLCLALYAMLGALAAMLRRQWAQNEALAFPLLRLPLEMTRDLDRDPAKGEREVPFFANRLMWAGFAVAVFVQALRGLNLYFPDVPTFPLELELGPYFTEAPWNQMGWVPVRTYLLAVGIAYLLTREVSFSFWFFYWFFKFQLVALYLMGYPASVLPPATQSVPGNSILGFQTVGCFLMFAALLLWTARVHLQHVGARALGRARADEIERAEVMSYPAAFWLFWGALIFVLAWMTLAGVRLDLALALWGLYLIYALGLTRVAAEGGVLSLLNDSLPLGIAGRLSGAAPGSWLNVEAGVVPASFVQGAFAFHMRGFAMPSFLHSFKLAYDEGIAPKRLLALLVAVVIISSSMGLWMAVRLGYENGALGFANEFWATRGSQRPATFVATISSASNNATAWNWTALMAGAGLTYLMMALRARYAGFLFHPIGFLMAQTYSATMFWFSFLLGWSLKSLILRFGGHEAYRRYTPTFLGLALGDVTMMLFWLAIASWQGRTGHTLLPN